MDGPAAIPESHECFAYQEPIEGIEKIQARAIDMLIAVIPFPGLCIGHADKWIVEYVNITTFYIGVQMVRLGMVLLPDIGIVSLQIKAKMKEKIIDLFILYGHPVCSIM
jgi:hypothetical protein